ncbi:MAG: MurR/RpiR family transcriptional regulator [Spirochaetia bacterium]|nr:MurR/RpiR family transcriptional regulator [Spirochaetia bacterium]
MNNVKNPLYLVEKNYNKLSKAEKKVADYVQLHPDKTILASLQIISEKCSVSDASVLRFCRTLGFSGYQDFKAALVPEILKRGVTIYEEINYNDSYQIIREKFTENLHQDIHKSISNITKSELAAVSKKIIEAEKIIIIGLAGSAGVARIFNDCLLGLGIYCHYLTDRVEIERIVNQLDKNDVIFGISHSGETQEVVFALKNAQKNQVYTIGMTNFASSSLAKYADINLLTTVPENILGSYSCQPRIAQLAVLEFITIEISRYMNS